MAKTRRKYETYRVVRASGELETLRIPRLFDAFTIASKLRHSLVFMEIPRGSSVSTETGMAEGPCTVYVDANTYDIHRVSASPTDGDHGYRLWKELHLS